MAHNVEYILKMVFKNTEKIDRVIGQTDRLEKKVNAAGNAFKKMGGIIGGVFAVRKLVAYTRESEAAYSSQASAISRLGQVMSNTMGAAEKELKQIIALTEAQEKLGVVATDVQQTGSQELATYLSKTSSLEKLLPVMNNMLAQQYGLNASQEQAINIASMMGKVMDGQVGALSRYGYKFSEAQERILKYGTEAQRAATLADVVSSAVGGVNKALAATPEGQEKQYKNWLGGLQTRYGKLYVMIKSKLMPMRKQVAGVFSGLLDWLEKNGQAVATVIGGIISGAMGVFNFVGSIITSVKDAIAPAVDALSSLFGTVWQVLSDNSGIMSTIFTTAIGIVISSIALLADIIGKILTPINAFLGALSSGEAWAVALAVAVGALTAAMTIGYIISKKQLILNKLGVVWLNVLILRETLLKKAVAAKNKVMLASPWGLAAAGIAGVIALVSKLSTGFNRFARAQRAITEKAAATYAEEKLQLDKLYKQLEKTMPQSKERNRLVDELKQLYPDIVKGMEDELRNTNDLTGAYTKLADEAKRSAVERAKAAVMDEKAKELFELQFKNQQLLESLPNEPWLAKMLNDKVSSLQNELNQIADLNVVAGVVLDKDKLKKQLTDIQKYFPHLRNIDLNSFLQPNSLAGTTGSTGTNGGGADGGAAGKDIETAVTGGTKSTNITINIGKLVEKMSFSSNDQQQNVNNMRDEVLDTLIRAVNMSQAAAIQ